MKQVEYALDGPDLVARVFELKLKSLIDDVFILEF